MKRKLFTFALSSTITISSILPSFANSLGSKSNSSTKTNIEAAIGFKFPENTDSLKNKNLTATLTGGNVNLEIHLKDFLDKELTSSNIDGHEIGIKTIKKNDKVISLLFRIENLAPNTYDLTLNAKNYTKTTIKLDTTSYSKRVNIDTGSTLSLGDVNSDGKIDNNDIELLENALNTNNTELDLNGDGKITIADISIANKSTGGNLDPIIFNTDISSNVILNNLDIQSISKQVSIENGKIEDIFTKGNVVTFSPKSGEDKINIPLEFKEAQEMSTISLTLNDNTPKENIQFLLLDEEGNSIETSNQYTTSIFRKKRTSETVVTINLGKRIPVKKVIINVTPTQNNGFVIVDEVKFLKDVVDDNFIVDTIVKNLVAKPGNEQVALSWRAVPNVTGYKIYYGKDPNKLDKIAVTDKTDIIIDGLDNLVPYHFAVAATSSNWEGEKSNIISATPVPKSKPLKPDFVTAKGEDSSIDVSWGKTENAEWYNIYIKKDGEQTPKKVLSKITSTSTTITNLENDVLYTVYVSAENNLGESPLSNPAEATPEKFIIVPPELPTKGMINNSNIENIEISHQNHYDKNLYPNGFDPNWLIDEKYETSWVARAFWEANAFSFTFKEAKTMDYLIWVPRLDKKYRNALKEYSITVWKEGDNLSSEGTTVAKSKRITQKGKDNSYVVLTFPKQENIKKIKVSLAEWEGNGSRVNASEVKFYEYNDISDRISNLFSDATRTEIKSGVTISDIESLEAEVNDLTGFIVDKETLLEELDIARKLVNNDLSAIGVIKDNIDSIKQQNDSQKYHKSINNFQPLGIVGKANEKLIIYAEIPEGEIVELVATQYFEEANKLTAPPIALVNGRNEITIPKIESSNKIKGGPLYITYSGDKKDEIKLHVKGEYTKVPYLELKDLHTLSEKDAKDKIREFITNLEDYVPTLQDDLEVQPLNSSEISLPDVLLSLPASKILEGITTGTSSIEERINRVYDTTLAWEDVFKVIYNTYGIDDHVNNGLETRHNIRYMQMFANAFMYASGNHIGIGYNSVPGLMNGKPVSKLSQSDTSNNLFGWGIAHEIGHVMDKLGKAEVTNNIYSLMVQTYDGDKNILKSRIENNNGYQKAFDKVSVGTEGLPNDGLAHLTMYWQLHLAYDEGNEPFKFYSEIHKKYRDGSLDQFTNYLDKFAIASSQVANKKLTEFFTRWGVKLSDDAKTEMSNLPKEDRAIYYLTDESRRKRLEGNNGNPNANITATAEVNPSNPKEVNITISGNPSDIQGYEILRNGKSIGFTITDTFTDTINSANNMTFRYSVKPVDILGNIGNAANAGEIRISYDNVIDDSKYTIDTSNSNELLVTFNEQTIVTGIKITPKDTSNSLPTGKFNISIYNENKDNDKFTDVKDGDFSKNMSNNSDYYITYLNKPGSTDDKMWSYDVKALKITGVDLREYNVEFISYPGDNIEFMNMPVGRLNHDYRYGDGPDDVIEKGTLIITGKYRGNTVTNKIRIDGTFTTSDPLSEEHIEVERAVNGYTIMFDEVPENGTITSDTVEGIFIFVPDIQKEEELQDGVEGISILPTKIKAIMYNSALGDSLTSDTIWISMPTDDSFPEIEIK